MNNDERTRLLETALVECFDIAIPQAMPWTNSVEEKAEYAAKTLPHHLRGLRRLDDHFRLEMERRYAEAIRLVWSIGNELYVSGLHGCEAESTHIRNSRMQNPILGDVVLETSTFYIIRSGREFWATPQEAIGVLDGVANEPIPGEWDEATYGPRPTEKVWYIKRFKDGELIRWVNANFVAISWITPKSEGSTNSTPHQNPKSDKVEECPTDSD